ncbi:fasciclin domain-containing protein [uncultured Bacteroides sp.]|uniref:fasciclin domain-containing protein n=1 Tax=uncultured Bacteroides sp. TaxID=162156 RepID=UPI0025EF002B|nr:fasciclin domain-containing protein [uncultured Bacteroides sp.]
MKKIIYNTLLFCWTIIALSGCDLELQKDYDYKPSVDDPHINMTAWEYLQENKGQFSELIAAIEYVGMQEYYTQTQSLYTYLALNNVAMQSLLKEKFSGATAITECDKEKLKDILLYHIVDGEYSSYGQLPVEPMFVLTMLKGEQGLMTICVWKNPYQSSMGKILINETGSNGNSPRRKSKASNIMPTNGVIHVFEQYCYYQR